jgi:hypothetical protein
MSVVNDVPRAYVCRRVQVLNAVQRHGIAVVARYLNPRLQSLYKMHKFLSPAERADSLMEVAMLNHFLLDQDF